MLLPRLRKHTFMASGTTIKNIITRNSDFVLVHECPQLPEGVSAHRRKNTRTNKKFIAL